MQLSQLLSGLFIGIHIFGIALRKHGCSFGCPYSYQVRRFVVGSLLQRKNSTANTNNLVSQHRARPTITFLFLRRLHRVPPQFEIFLFPSVDSKTMS